MVWARLLLVSILALVAACGSGESSTRQATTATSAASTAAAGAATAPAQPRGELRIGVDFLPTSFDPAKSPNLLRLGIAETLTRLTPDLKVEPWLAERVTNVDPLTWRVTLRSNATFHDGAPVTAEAVVASFKRNWELQPATNGIISKDTVVTAINPTTVEFKTPQPDGALPNNLTAFQFAVHKLNGDNAVTTGPYKPVRLVTDEQAQLEAYTGHWSGPPPIAKITARLVRDPQARALALQSGEIDLLVGLPLALVDALPADFERPVVTGLRVQYILFNHTREPFNDRAVREAVALGIDRNALNKTGFEGQGKIVTSIFPPVPGIEVVAAQSGDAARARQLLDQAGWTPGSDGVRAKGGKRLAFTLYSYPQRADLTPMAVAIQSQLKPLGFDIKLEQTQDVTKLTAGGDFDATMYSVGQLPTGDPLYALSQELATSGSFNFGKYSNAELDRIVGQLRGEVDPARRQALSKQAQEIIKADTPNVYLVASPLVYAYRKGKVQGLTLHPNDLYMIDTKLSVR